MTQAARFIHPLPSTTGAAPSCTNKSIPNIMAAIIFQDFTDGQHAYKNSN